MSFSRLPTDLEPHNAALSANLDANFSIPANAMQRGITPNPDRAWTPSCLGLGVDPGIWVYGQLGIGIFVEERYKRL